MNLNREIDNYNGRKQALYVKNVLRPRLKKKGLLFNNKKIGGK